MNFLNSYAHVTIRRPFRERNFELTPHKADKYRRRVEYIENKRFNSRQGRILDFSFMALTGSLYTVLFADFGEREHCYTPLRNWVAQKTNKFWTLSDKEKQELREQGRLK
ncbi:13192_t:CDS:2 [Ambispora leptoticha]|uniref:13192_t:CDS:1 n=1 Tax=Ambispora leptoticha TaxID=144679 RepID=A0A9N9C1R5_9GLOM|nr:13192_t:CDS:2 [Ambispora leptoticha]